MDQNHWTLVADSTSTGFNLPPRRLGRCCLAAELVQAWTGSRIVEGPLGPIDWENSVDPNFHVEGDIRQAVVDQGHFWLPVVRTKAAANASSVDVSGISSDTDLSTDMPAGFLILSLILDRKVVVVSATDGGTSILGGPKLPDVNPIYILYNGNQHYVPLWSTGAAPSGPQEALNREPDQACGDHDSDDFSFRPRPGAQGDVIRTPTTQRGRRS